MPAAATDKFRKSYAFLSKTLSSGVDSSTGTIPLNNATNVPTDTAVTFIIDRVDSNGNLTPTLREICTGVVSGSNIISTTRGQMGTTAQVHALGAVVEFVVSAQMQNDMIDALLVSHNQDGTMITSLPLTTPKITTSINDSGGNEVIKTPATASAVNEITITNAAAGSPPKISATGGDTDIDLYLLGKGAGSPRFAGLYDGWVAANETLTYASATTLTCSAALAAILAVGDRIKLTQTTVKYFAITGISGTTITITGGTDYTLANAAITLPFYSHEESPTGYPQYFAYTPAWTTTGTAPAIGNGTLSGSFSIIGKTCAFRVSWLAGSTTTFGTLNYRFSLPVTASGAIAATTPIGWWYGEFPANQGYIGEVNLSTTTTVLMHYHSASIDGAAGQVSATGPTTWANTYFQRLSGTYQIA
jgi:hypothetical protein